MCAISSFLVIEFKLHGLLGIFYLACVQEFYLLYLKFIMFQVPKLRPIAMLEDQESQQPSESHP